MKRLFNLLIILVFSEFAGPAPTMADSDSFGGFGLGGGVGYDGHDWNGGLGGGGNIGGVFNDGKVSGGGGLGGGFGIGSGGFGGLGGGYCGIVPASNTPSVLYNGPTRRATPVPCKIRFSDFRNAQNLYYHGRHRGHDYDDDDYDDHVNWRIRIGGAGGIEIPINIPLNPPENPEGPIDTGTDQPAPTEVIPGDRRLR